MTLDLRKEGKALRKSIQPYVDTLFRTTSTKFLNSETISSKTPEVTLTIDSGKHTVRINGVAIESFWREKAANSLADRIRNALSQ